MNRRDTLVALLALSAAGPLAAVAQQPGRSWRVGLLIARRRPDSIDADFIGAFPREMRELGYIEGKNLVIEWRFLDGKPERLPDLAAELVRLKIDVLVSSSTQGVSALQKATTTIPIVMAGVGDPVGSGFVASLARPGGNITGLSNLQTDIIPKQLELLRSMVPRLSRVALLMNPANAFHAISLKNAQDASQQVKVAILPVEARTAQEIGNAFAIMKQGKAEAVIVLGDATFLQQYGQIAELATRDRLPSISSFRQFVEAGGLMNYGQDFTAQFRQAATYVDKIFKGAKPADLPVAQSTKFELFVNRKAAQALGLAIPRDLLLRADRVIE